MKDIQRLKKKSVEMQNLLTQQSQRGNLEQENILNKYHLTISSAATENTQTKDACRFRKSNIH